MSVRAQTDDVRVDAGEHGGVGDRERVPGDVRVRGEMLVDLIQAGRARRTDRQAGIAQVADDGFGRLGVVVDDQHPDGGINAGKHAGLPLAQGLGCACMCSLY